MIRRLFFYFIVSPSLWKMCKVQCEYQTVEEPTHAFGAGMNCVRNLRQDFLKWALLFVKVDLDTLLLSKKIKWI